MAPDYRKDYLETRDLDDGRFLGVGPLLFGLARLVITEPGPDGSGDVADEWHYEHVTRALAAMMAWDPAASPEPAGWTRHPRTGRRRPLGDPAGEYIQE